MSKSPLEMVLTAVSCLVIVVGWCWIGFDLGKYAMRKEAVKHGAAVWVVDEAGNATFVWKDSLEKKP